MTEPYLLGIGINAHIGTDKILFSIEYDTETEVYYDYVVLFYPEPFLYHTKDTNYKDYNKKSWYDNYYYTYKRSDIDMDIKLYKKNNNKYVKLYDHDDNKTSNKQ